MSTRGSATVGKREASGTRVDAIIEAALQLFLERGYDNTPLSAVAERLGLTKAGVYHGASADLGAATHPAARRGRCRA
jgi:hypothetical protein